MSDDDTELEEVRVERDDGEGEYAIVVEVSRRKNFQSRQEAIHAARSMRASLADDAALSGYNIGRPGVRKLD